ncbi:MAG: hypothetical protein JWQ94_4181 [Tardiphaga sp.]|nr:hypothetical protein [Tardiphaga sp.]
MEALRDGLSGVNFLSYGLNGDGRPTQISADQLVDRGALLSWPTATPQLDPATVVTLSAEAQDRLDAMKLWEVPQFKLLPEPEPSGFTMTPDKMQQVKELKDLELKLGALDRLEEARSRNNEALQHLRASYKKLRDTPPKAAVKLNAEDTEKALQMLKDAGRTLIYPGKDGSYGYVEDGVQYNFKGDGTVTVQEEGVATSPQTQRQLFAAMDESMERLHDWLRDTSGERATLLSQREALLSRTAA